MQRFHANDVVLLVAILLNGISARSAEPDISTLVHPGKDGKLTYQPYSERGDTIPDFSNCGYMGGGVRLQDVAAREVLEPDLGSGDDRARIQAAIDRVAQIPADRNGIRGAVLLKRGTYLVHPARPVT
jgi:hypothetical protein